ncbi:MAG: LamG domain-containing protein, partial [Candidatus Micrarchaeota archaeon]|nr:LamG domain-containing protein [Candidatus Micrarchaeota archaeon]
MARPIAHPFSYAAALIFFLNLGFAIPSMGFVSPTPANASWTMNTTIGINVSINESNLGSVVYNWNGTNYTIYDSNLLVLYNFNNLSSIGENSTLAVDSSPNRNNATISGATWNAAGRYGRSLYFNGASYANTTSNILNGASQFTFSVWINPSALGNWRGIISKYINDSNVTALQIHSDGSVYFDIDSGNNVNGYTSGGLITAGNWHHLALVFNGSGATNADKVKIYVNGVQRSLTFSGTLPSATVSNNAPLTIGGLNSSLNLYTGLIDEVKIWNRSLNADEIYVEYASTLQRTNTSQWYLFINQSKNATTGLNLGNYTYQAFGSDQSAGSNQTPQRLISIGVTSCGTLNDAGRTYILIQSVNSSSTCFSISAANITLDCAGYNVTGTNSAGSYGISITSVNATVRNCNVFSYSNEFYLSGAQNVTIDNCNATHNYYTGLALSLTSSLATISNSNFRVVNSSSDASACSLSASNYGRFQNFTCFTASSSNGDALQITSGSSYNSFSNGTLISLGRNALYSNNGTGNNFTNLYLEAKSASISLHDTKNNTLDNITAISNGSFVTYGAYLIYSSSYNIIRNSNIYNYVNVYAMGFGSEANLTYGNQFIGNNFSSPVAAFSIDSALVYNNTFINNTFTTTSTNQYAFRGVYSQNSTFIGNKFVSTTGTAPLLYLGASGNILYWNNFTATSGVYANSTVADNHFNFTINGQPEGNFWHNIMNGSINVSGIGRSSGYPAFFIGATGPGYPYNRTNSNNKVSSNVVDYGPLTFNYTDLPAVNYVQLLNQNNGSSIFDNDTLVGWARALDGASSTLTLFYKWYKNGTLNQTGSLAGVANNTIVNVANISTSWLAADQNWTLEVTANDGTQNGSALNSSTATILPSQTPPVVLVSSINNSTGGSTFYVNYTLLGYARVIDNQSTTLNVSFRWYLNGVLNSAGTYFSMPNNTLTNIANMTATARLQNWTLEVTAIDPVYNSTPLNSTTITVSNRAPVMANVSINNSTGGTIYWDNDILVGWAQANDSDNDSINFTYRWYRNGVIFQNGTFNNSIPWVRINIANMTSGLSGGQNWTLEVWAFDGLNNSSRMNSSTIRINTSNIAPTAYLSSINNSTGGTYFDYSSTLVGWAIANDSENETLTIFYRWFRNGSLYSSGSRTGVANNTLTNVANISGVLGGQNWTLEITAFDGTANSTPLNSTQISINNTPPTTNTPTLSLATAYKNTSNITCYNSTTEDPDNHTISFYYLWYRNGESTGITTQHISNSSYNKSQTLICQITPFDGYLNGTAKNSSPLTISNSPPVMTTASINNSTGGSTFYNFSTLLGFARAIDADGDLLNYAYIWYMNNTVNSSGTSAGNPAGALVNVANLTSGISSWQRWILEIAATDGTDFSSPLNSTEINILPIPQVNVVINSPASNSNYSSNNITINLTVNGTFFNYTNISIMDSEGNVVNSTINSSIGTYTVSMGVPGDGIYTITAMAYDVFGSYFSDSVYNITLDTSAPSLSITNPQD